MGRGGQPRPGSDETVGYAVHAAASSGDDGVRRELVVRACGATRARPDFLIEVARCLYPKAMTATELATIMLRWTACSDDSTHNIVYGSPWYFLDEVQTAPRLEEIVAVLGDALVERLGVAWGGPGAVPDDALRLAALLKTVLTQRLKAGGVDGRIAEVWAPCAYAVSRVAEGSRQSDHHLDIRELFDEPGMSRAVLRWLIRRREPAGRLDDPWEFFKGEPHSVTPRSGDSPWILTDLAWAADREERRLLLGLAYRAATADDLECIDAAGEDPSLLRFLVDRIEERRRDRWGHTNWRSLIPVYGEDVAEAARSGLKLFWRRHTPMLRNERTKTNEVEWFVPVGLTGLNIAFDDGLDPTSLSDDDVVLATRFALREMNAFPEWFARLAEARPAGVLGVMEQVLGAEYFGRSAATTGRLIADIHYRDATIKRLVVPVIVDLLTAREAEAADVLDEALRIVGAETGSRGPGLVAAARGRALLDGGAAGVAWWKFLVPLDPVAALGVLERQAELADEAALTAMQTVIAGVDWSNIELSPIEWKALILLMYRSARPADDVNRAGRGVYSPDLRDEAQEKRSAIVARLSALPGEHAYRALMELSEHPTVAPHGDNFRSLARSRAGQDAEPPAWAVAELHEFLRRGALRPSTPDEPFDLVMDRLAGAAHDLEEGDFSCRELLAPRAHERVVQKYLAYVLHLSSREHYSVAREEEVLLGKMPDIRLHGNFGDPHPVISIEVKIADNWPLARLESDLTEQLVGQYLRDARSRHGIFVLLRKAELSWTDAENGTLSFPAVCDRLANQAAALAVGGLTVRVVSIDVCPGSERDARQEPPNAPRARRSSGAGERRKLRFSKLGVTSDGASTSE